ncbi:hypothetical protein [Arthrobacter methylotrophus]|uniref:hypothetical protein n=1 Tax=Arthrobacter methylotrophus TaxID=121291 RepID=UPI0031EC06AD
MSEVCASARRAAAWLRAACAWFSFLVDFGRVEQRQHVALVHMRADVLEPAHHVAAGARVDGRFHIALQRAGQGELAVGAGRLGRDGGDVAAGLRG